MEEFRAVGDTEFDGFILTANDSMGYEVRCLGKAE
jgi:hypothetical protein